MTRDELEWKAEMYERLHANSKLWQAYKDGCEISAEYYAVAERRILGLPEQKQLELFS